MNDTKEWNFYLCTIHASSINNSALIVPQLLISTNEFTSLLIGVILQYYVNEKSPSVILPLACNKCPVLFF